MAILLYTALTNACISPRSGRLRWVPIIIGVVFVILLVQGTAAAPATIVTVASSEAGDQAAYVTADYVCDGVDDQIEIQAALDAVLDGGMVFLTEGTFYCAGSISPGAGGTVKGQGPDATFLSFSRNGRLNVSEERVTLDGFHIQGTGYQNMSTRTELCLDMWLGVVTVYASHTRVHQVTGTADDTIQAVFLVLHDPNVYEPILEDIEFIDCRAIDTGTYGFLHNAWGTDNTTIKNVRYENCHAINCGRFGAFNSWVTGFDFAELNDIEGLRVRNCTAVGNLESGFHFEWEADVADAIFSDCMSRDNGRKPYPDAYLVGDTHYFGSGYYIPGGEVILNSCRAEGNSAFGFFISNPESIRLNNCTDAATGRRAADTSVIKPASFCLLQSRPVSAEPSIVLENCRSINANGWGLFICGGEAIHIRNFTLIDPAGIGGLGAVFGCPEAELPVNSSVRPGVFNSTFDLYASGNRPSTMLYILNNQNVTYAGEIVSDGAQPVVIDGADTSNVTVSDLRIVSGDGSADAMSIINLGPAEAVVR